MSVNIYCTIRINYVVDGLGSIIKLVNKLWEVSLSPLQRRLATENKVRC